MNLLKQGEKLIHTCNTTFMSLALEQSYTYVCGENKFFFLLCHWHLKYQGEGLLLYYGTLRFMF